MVTLPSDFTAIKYPGYFWNIQKKHLYSIKSGTLTPLKFNKANRWNHGIAGYKISVNGDRRLISLKYLSKLQSADSIIPVWKNE